MPAGSDKLFKKNLGGALDNAYDGYQAFLKELNATKKINGFKDPICDLAKLKSKINSGLALYGKAGLIMNEYRRIIATMPKNSSGVTQAPAVLTSIANTHAQQAAEMRKHLPSDADVAKFRIAYMQATLKQI